MDGLLIIDKPAGPTSHDVVERMRRVLGERRIGHTGTLDPAATGVLALVLGCATRLAQFLSTSDKTYEAVVRFGFATDTGDTQGRAIGVVSGAPPPSRAAIEAALDAFRGTFVQQPPAFSAKKIEGMRSHRLARARSRAAEPTPSPAPRDALPLPAPVSVTVYRLDVVGLEADCVTLAVHCSAGFYVRALAQDLGERLGAGAHLAALRRTRAGDFGVEDALRLDAAEQDPDRARAAVIPPAAMLARLPAVTLTADEVRRTIDGRDLDRPDAAVPGVESLVRLLDPAGDLVAIARPSKRPGLLHPAVVLR